MTGKMNSKRFWAIAGPLTTIFIGQLVAGGAGVVLVANKGDQALGLIDVSGPGKQIAAVPEGGVTGHEVIASPDGKFAYVPIYGDSGVGKPGSDGRSIAVIDLGSKKVVG